jgi:hypothetical protein
MAATASRELPLRQLTIDQKSSTQKEKGPDGLSEPLLPEVFLDIGAARNEARSF